MAYSINKAKEIYVDLVMNNTKENVEAKYAIAQMVLTEAILTSEEDISFAPVIASQS